MAVFVFPDLCSQEKATLAERISRLVLWPSRPLPKVVVLPMLLTQKERLFVSNPVSVQGLVSGRQPSEPAYLHKQWNGIESSDHNPVVNIPSEDVESPSAPFNYLLHADALLGRQEQFSKLALWEHGLQRSSQLAQCSLKEASFR